MIRALVNWNSAGAHWLATGSVDTERLAEAGTEPSVGSVGDSYDNAFAETINGLDKAELIHRRGPWRSFEAVEFATLSWVGWFNHHRLLELIGNIPPAKAEQRYYAMLDEPAMAAWLKPNGLRRTRGVSEMTHTDFVGRLVLRRRSEMTLPGRRLRLQHAGAKCNLRPLSRAKAGDDLESPTMRKWKKPRIIEVTVGCEVTSYAPAKL